MGFLKIDGLIQTKTQFSNLCLDHQNSLSLFELSLCLWVWGCGGCGGFLFCSVDTACTALLCQGIVAEENPLCPCPYVEGAGFAGMAESVGCAHRTLHHSHE